MQFEGEFHKATGQVILTLTKLLQHEGLGVRSSTVDILGIFAERGEHKPHVIGASLMQREEEFPEPLKLASPALAKLLRHDDPAVYHSAVNLPKLPARDGECSRARYGCY
jgi:hypothetical protein